MSNPLAAPLAFALALLSPGSGQTAPSPANEASAHPGQLARLPDGRRLNFRCSGHGSPTVILEGGYAATSLAWTRVRAQVEKTNRVCTYDRAGFGFSDPGPLPRDGAAIARDLDRGLRAAKIGGPFILVGHSAGALYVRLFSNRRPLEVVGLVLVDPSVEHQDTRFAEAFGPGAGGVGSIRLKAAMCLEAAELKLRAPTEPELKRCAATPRPDQPAKVNAARLAESLRPSTWRAQISELDNLWPTTSNQIDAGRQSYGDLPIIVLSADGTYASAPPAQELWLRLHDELAAKSSRGVHRVVANSSHMLMNEHPEAVTDAIAEVAAVGNARPSR
ncbi:MAG: alpha/beta hydrolase [Phenylobacterium sp.]|uniref:alpha/beta fold hydrolase n=1 Tax=Phenylobacterium sp. TaxID=1871053 RepID=UPI002723B37F|nr:alpha/beta hydrolase [Phenylobacterium sp.]MDO9431542.1 alpha/beta hydrolase [Phenylobacterium sp.]